MTIPCLTLTQPWASLVAIGAKRIETRSWKTAYRGPLAIHAAKAFPANAKDFCTARMVCEALDWPTLPSPLTQAALDENERLIDQLPLGSVLCFTVITDCQRIIQCEHCDGSGCEFCGKCGGRPEYLVSISEQEAAFGNYEVSRFAFLLDRPLALPELIPAKGSLGLWQWEVPKNLEMLLANAPQPISGKRPAGGARA